MRKYILIYIFFSINILAQDLNTPIKILVEKIKRANPEDRRVLINQLKVELRKVNRENRKKSMMELKRAFRFRYNRGEKREYRHRGYHRRRHFRRMQFRSHP